MVDDTHSFPQDEGTGLDDTVDWDDAAGFAQLAHDINTVDYVVDGFTFDVNWSTDTLNVAGGVARLYQSQAQTNDHTADGGDPSKALLHTVFTVQAEPSGDIGLAANDTTYVYIGLDQQSNNNVIWQTNTDETPPSEPYLRLGYVDTDTETIAEENRRPAGEFRSLVVK